MSTPVRREADQGVEGGHHQGASPFSALRDDPGHRGFHEGPLGLQDVHEAHGHPQDQGGPRPLPDGLHQGEEEGGGVPHPHDGPVQKPLFPGVGHRRLGPGSPVALALATTSGWARSSTTSLPKSLSLSGFRPQAIIRASTRIRAPAWMAFSPASTAPWLKRVSALYSKSAVAWIIRRTTGHSRGRSRGAPLPGPRCGSSPPLWPALFPSSGGRGFLRLDQVIHGTPPCRARRRGTAPRQSR